MGKNKKSKNWNRNNKGNIEEYDNLEWLQDYINNNQTETSTDKADEEIEEEKEYSEVSVSEDESEINNSSDNNESNEKEKHEVDFEVEVNKLADSVSKSINLYDDIRKSFEYKNFSHTLSMDDDWDNNRKVTFISKVTVYEYPKEDKYAQHSPKAKGKKKFNNFKDNKYDNKKGKKVKNNQNNISQDEDQEKNKINQETLVKGKNKKKNKKNK
jgi:hypothetical protein